MGQYDKARQQAQDSPVALFLQSAIIFLLIGVVIGGLLLANITIWNEIF